MRSLVVVDVTELVELGLELVEGGGSWMSSEPFLEGLVESFHLALGLGVIGAAVTVVDAQRPYGSGEGVLVGLGVVG
jgi:hypothetical protein